MFLEAQIMGVVREPNLEASAKLLIMWLAKQDNASTFYSQRAMAWELGIHYVTVNYLIKMLCDIGIMERFYMRNELGHRLRTESAGEWVKAIRERHESRVKTGDLVA